MGSTEQRLQELLDRQEIHDVLMDYSRGVDRGDAEMIDSAYHPDAVDVHSSFEGHAPDLGKLIVSRHKDGHCRSVMHRITNELVRVDGDSADAESYLHASLVFEVEGRSMVYDAHGRYMHRFERRDGRWKIARGQVTIDYAYFTEFTDWRPEPGTSAATLGLKVGILATGERDAQSTLRSARFAGDRK